MSNAKTNILTKDNIEKLKSELNVSSQCTIYHKELGHLSYIELVIPKNTNDNKRLYLSFPLEFKSIIDAHRWIRDGDIDDLILEFGYHNINFTTESLIWE